MSATTLRLIECLHACSKPSSTTTRLAVSAVMALFSTLITWNGWPGSAVALMPLISLLVLCAKQRNKRWSVSSMAATALPIGGCIAIAIEPGPLNLFITWASLAALALSLRGHDFSNLARTANIFLTRTLMASGQLTRDARLLRQKSRRAAAPWPTLQWQHAVLPLAAATAFAMLLAEANPVIDGLFKMMSWKTFLDALRPFSLVIMIATFVLSWALFRMKPAVPAKALEIDHPAPPWHTGYFAPGPVALTLAILNAMFLLQNGLDASFIWSGTDLPPGMTYASYVQRGANTLILTVLMAAGLIILALWPGSRTERSRLVQGLVYLWIVQNVMLVISCVARTFSYIDAYGMSMLRLSGLIWMALIVIGLALIAIRVLTMRGNLWLLNSNLAAAFVVLWVSGLMDYRAIVADYNVERAIAHATLDPDGVLLKFDVDYLRELGTPAIPAARRLAAFAATSPRPLRLPNKQTEAGILLAVVLRNLENQNSLFQNDWRTWTLRGWRRTASSRT